MPIVTDLNNQKVKWKVAGKEVYKDLRPRSQLHLVARELIKSRFPTLQVLEEVPIPLRKGKTLYLDFYLPLRKLAVEVHGEQHYKFSSLFHATRADFLGQKRNDRDKEEWCLRNNIELIVLPYDKVEEWQKII